MVRNKFFFGASDNACLQPERARGAIGIERQRETGRILAASLAAAATRSNTRAADAAARVVKLEEKIAAQAMAIRQQEEALSLSQAELGGTQVELAAACLDSQALHDMLETASLLHH